MTSIRNTSSSRNRSKPMKRLTVILVAVLLFTACGQQRDRGQLVGVQDRPAYAHASPPGMVLIPMGSFVMGPSEQDITYSHDATNRTVSMSSFYMDETEITNNQYRQFVHWVRDSIARQILANEAATNPELERYALIDDDGLPVIDDRTGEVLIRWPSEGGPRRIDWDIEYDFGDRILEEMFLQEDERFFHRRELDSRKLVYEYYEIDLQRAAREPGIPRRDLVVRNQIPVYPDTLVWIRDFTYYYNEPMTEMYFWHPTYDHYPVVGVSWNQARVFNLWRTEYLNAYLSRNDQPFPHKFELPSEAQWEYAARGGRTLSPYPWGGPYISDHEYCFQANFLPQRGNYTATGGMYPIIVGHYPPNDYGLYDMAGNVAEWTRTAYSESFYYIMPDMNPDYQYRSQPNDPPALKRKVVRGGSWKDIGYFLQVSTRSYEYEDSATAHIGFRSVQSFPGRGMGNGRRGGGGVSDIPSNLY